MKLILTAMLILKNFTTLCAQHPYFSLGVEVGAGSAPGIYAQSFAVLSGENLYYKIKNSRVGEIGLFADKPNPRVFEYALLLGKNYNLGRLHNFQLGAGLAFTAKVSQGKYIGSGGEDHAGIIWGGYSIYEKIQRNTIGLPLEAKYNFQLGSKIAISVSANANINAIQSFGGLSVGTFIGRVR